MWLGANKRDDIPDNDTIAMVRQQVCTAFAASPDFAKLDDAARQEYAEALMFQLATLGVAFGQSRNDPRVADEFADEANRNAQTGGIDLSLMILTPMASWRARAADTKGASN